MSPFLDARGAEGAKHPSRNGPLLTHLPPCVFQPVKGSKYIYVARNPNDCAVSFYHFLNGFQQRDFVDFDEFLTLFLSGKVPYGDYFDHLLFWYGRREDSNIHFVTYEQLKQDTREEVLKMADFLGAEHGTALRQDETLICKVLEACRLDNMRTFIKENPVDRFQRATHVLCAASGESNEALKNHEEVGGEIRNTSDFLRKGVVGDWKGYFTREQMEKTKAWIEEKTQGSDVMNLWQDFGLP
ncbi:hypothetical protein V5799_001143 [Amblyomma americanum]|uniref:Sulfotransferase domain-containing protein n=1 Tax=Amblyomma americanum TaxID=6943 RepID=A0AAQ4D115_AMBAM